MNRLTCAFIVLTTIFSMNAIFSLHSMAQDPVTAEEAGLIPLSSTIYVNPLSTSNNGSTESLGVDITSNENVVLGWEDDGDGLLDLESVWTMYDINGISLTPNTTITSTQSSDTLSSKFLSYFRADGSAVPGNTSWGPKIKANKFGAGFGMGATSFSLGLEIPELGDINLDAGGGGDFPGVQLMNNDGTPIRVVSGLSEIAAEPAGDVRIGDWDYLSNGNIVIMGESRQEDDLVVEFGGSAPNRHAVYRVVDANGNEVKTVSLVSSSAEDRVEVWHGAAVTANGFALRFAANGRATVRLFDNSGNPTTENIDIATLTGDEFTAGGGRGDGAGFDGNGIDTYAITNQANVGGNNATFLTVFNADGSLRYSRIASDDREFSNSDRVDVAVDALGQAIAVFDDNDVTNLSFRVIQARGFDVSGEPLTPTFFVSELATETSIDALIGDARRARIAIRGNKGAVVWESSNTDDPVAVVALRTFQVGEAQSNVDDFMLYQ